MYLLVFVTLIISMIGVYAQVVSVQTARMFAHQNGVAEAMVAWHTAASSMATNIIQTNASAYNTAIAAAPSHACSLTYHILPGSGLQTCVPPLGAGVPPTEPGAVTDDSNTVGALTLLYNTASGVPECVHLPAICKTPVAGGCTSCTPAYDSTNYQFYSILYQSPTNNLNYVVTYIVSQTGYITMPQGNLIGLTTTDMMHQLQHTNTPTLSYGYVNASTQLITPVMTLPMPSFITSGSIAIASVPN